MTVPVTALTQLSEHNGNQSRPDYQGTFDANPFAATNLMYLGIDNLICLYDGLAVCIQNVFSVAFYDLIIPSMNYSIFVRNSPRVLD